MTHRCGETKNIIIITKHQSDRAPIIANSLLLATCVSYLHLYS